MGNEILRPYNKEANKLLKYFKKLELVHVPREFNSEADHLAKSKLEDFVRTKEETK